MAAEESAKRRVKPSCLAWGAVAHACRSIWVLYIDMERATVVARLQADLRSEAAAEREVARLRAALDANPGRYLANAEGAKCFVADHAPQLKWTIRSGDFPRPLGPSSHRRSR